MKLRTTPTFALACAAATYLGGCAPEAAPAERPHVLLVTLDTTRADYLGCYGGVEASRTPHLDALAADGVLFEMCVGQSGATPISHASIMTGLWPFQHGVRVIYALSGYRLPQQVPYLPELLRTAGYQTAAFLSSFTVSEFFGFDRAFELFDNGLSTAADALMNEDEDGTFRWGHTHHQRRSDHTADQVIAWLRQRPADRPFFLWTHFWDPHDADQQLPETFPPADFTAPNLERAQQTGLDSWRALYATEVTWVDRQFGRLIDELKKQGLYDKTVIVVVADHGQGLGEHGWWAHRLLYQEQIHLPLLMRIPGWPTGQRVESMVRSVDVFSTVLDALELDSPDVVGSSLRTLANGEPDQPRLAYAEALNKFDLNSTVAEKRPSASNLYCITDGTWKLIFRPDDPDASELYRLDDDPDEARNLYAENTAQAERLRGILDEWSPYRREAFPLVGDQPTDADVEALRSLGYVGNDDPDEGGK